MIGFGMQMSAMAPTPLTAPQSNPPPSSSSMRSPPTPLQSLSLALLSLPPSSSGAAHRASHPADHLGAGTEPNASAPPVVDPVVARVRLSDIAPYDGAPCGAYVRAVEALSGSLTRHNAAVIELGSDESALIRCAFEATKMYFKTRAQGHGGSLGKSGRGMYIYRAGR